MNHHRTCLVGLVLVALLLFNASLPRDGALNRLFAANASETMQTAASVPTPTAPAGGEEAEDVPKKPSSYLMWMIESLGWHFAPIILVLSLTMVALFVNCSLVIRREVMLPSAFSVQFKNLLDEKKYQQAYELAKENDSFLARILAAGLEKISLGYARVAEAMESVGEEETLKIENRLKILSIIGNVAPMLGLFGTVMGMIEAFQTIAGSVSAPPAYKLAQGISTALFHTEAGLALAIPSIAFYEVMKTRFTLLIFQAGQTSDSLMSRFRK